MAKGRTGGGAIRGTCNCVGAQNSRIYQSVSLSDPPPNTRRGVVLMFVFLLSLIGGATVLGRFLPFPDVPGVGERFRYFADHRDEYDTVFIGSSRFRHQLIPEVFEARAKEGGLDVQAFNLGYSGMWPPESYYYLRQILALKPAHLKWVVIELMDYRFGPVDEDKPTERMVYWHDRTHTTMAWRLVAETQWPLAKKVDHYARHTRLFLQNFMHIGQGLEWLAWKDAPSKKKKPRWARRDGYEAQEESPWSEGSKAAFARQVESAQASLMPQVLRPGFAADLREIVAEVRRAGVEPLLVIPPTVIPAENIQIGVPEDVPLLAFSRPDEYPELYQPETHYDPGHLNEKGAVEFSRLVAERFVQVFSRR